MSLISLMTNHPRPSRRPFEAARCSLASPRQRDLAACTTLAPGPVASRRPVAALTRRIGGSLVGRMRRAAGVPHQCQRRRRNHARAFAAAVRTMARCVAICDPSHHHKRPAVPAFEVVYRHIALRSMQRVRTSRDRANTAYPRRLSRAAPAHRHSDGYRNRRFAWGAIALHRHSEYPPRR